MPLQQGIQLIVTVAQTGVGYHCYTFDGLALPHPVLIQFEHVGSASASRDMDQLAAALLAELQGSICANRLPAPCGGLATICHALREADCQKLLVLVGDDFTAAVPSTLAKDWFQTSGNFQVLPVLPDTARPRAPMLLSGPLSAINVAFWSQGIEEALPAVFQVAGITAAQPRIFISYRQTDVAAAAIQLFDVLSHDGFDVFLDHFRVPPGVNFQQRLRQELGDKAMVLVLESPNLASSRWVAFEIAEARASGLGLAALNFSGAPLMAGIDPSLRLFLNAADIAAGGEIENAALGRVRAFVRSQHDRALLRRRILLEQSFEQAVVQAGGRLPQRFANGSFRIVAPTKSYHAWLTPRPPELPDYHRAYGATLPGTEAVIIGLSNLMEVSRQRQHEWLAGLCNMTLIDEGMMARAVGDMVRGTL
ncbi:TIR domain-containing protein [Rhodobacter viridis]|uniref:TIR domain-containing protein n=1 Tax=Rhodobacter viridis TaxID=1054202 RepID=A0A318TUW8_9RHOB|nr:toll/interleukin-1 receptor domain-containing protein [Rhodobacter viridis]PYF08671.1 TIR domain-containing protein [Rhodobacter viridis]